MIQVIRTVWLIDRFHSERANSPLVWNRMNYTQMRALEKMVSLRFEKRTK